MSSGASDTPVEQTAGMLLAMVEAYARQASYSSMRKDRLTELMERRVSTSWSPEKKARMARRLFAAGNDVQEASDAIDRLKHRLSQLASEAT